LQTIAGILLYIIVFIHLLKYTSGWYILTNEYSWQPVCDKTTIQHDCQPKHIRIITDIITPKTLKAEQIRCISQQILLAIIP